MQEDIQNRAVALVISTSRLTGRTLQYVLRQLAHELEKRKQNQQPELPPQGKQSLKELIGQGAGATNIEVNDSNIKAFERVARKYGVDYALRKDKTAKRPRWLVFFKARDADALTAAFNEFSAKVMQPDKKPSLLKQLAAFKEKTRAKGIDLEQKKEQELTR